jgi:hypothetical protein
MFLTRNTGQLRSGGGQATKLCTAEERRAVVRFDRWNLHDAICVGELEHATFGGIYREKHRLASHPIGRA